MPQGSGCTKKSAREPLSGACVEPLGREEANVKAYSVISVLAICVTVVGCIQQESSSSCVDNDEQEASEAPPEVGQGDGGTENVIAGNEPCSAHAECASNECVPTVVHAPDATGRCWSDTFNGCALVNFDEWVIDAMCGQRELAVCQLAANSEMQAHCVPPDGGAAPWIANFQCCDPSFL
jgi:hypothetical protein